MKTPAISCSTQPKRLQDENESSLLLSTVSNKKKKPYYWVCGIIQFVCAWGEKRKESKKKLSCVAVNHRDDMPDCEISNGGHAVVQINLGSEER